MIGFAFDNAAPETGAPVGDAVILFIVGCGDEREEEGDTTAAVAFAFAFSTFLPVCGDESEEEDAFAVAFFTLPPGCGDESEEEGDTTAAVAFVAFFTFPPGGRNDSLMKWWPS